LSLAAPSTTPSCGSRSAAGERRRALLITRNRRFEALHFAAEGKVHATYATDPLENIYLDLRLRDVRMKGRIVLDFDA
jgi:hypothetical protein